MRLSLIICVLLTSFALAQDPSKNTNPGSLWTATSKDYLRDRIARREGDILTILISETSASSFSANTKAEKNDKVDVAKGIGPFFANLIPALGIGASSSNSGKGSTDQAGSFTARMSVIVKKVLPNGTMLIEGTRAVVVNRETQLFTLTGLVRQDDVKSDNTVLSEFIADAQIKAEGKGMISDRQRKGLLTRLIDWLF